MEGHNIDWYLAVQMVRTETVVKGKGTMTRWLFNLTERSTKALLRQRTLIEGHSIPTSDGPVNDGAVEIE